MDSSCFRSLLQAWLAALVIAMCHHFLGAEAKTFIGVNYGGKGLSSKPLNTAAAVNIMKKAGVTAVKLFSTYPEVLEALAGTGLEVMSGLTNQEMTAVAGNQTAAQKWVDQYVVPYAAKTKITALAVGNEIIFPGGPVNNLVVPAMRKIYAALKARNLHGRIKVVSPCGAWVATNTYPPSASQLEPSLKTVMLDMLNFLQSTGSYFVVNIYPFFTYLYFPQLVDPRFVFFEGLHGYYDKSLYYQNQHDAVFDAMVWAMEKAGYPKLPIVVGESGWPTAGSSIATVANARKFNERLIGKWLSNQGSPKRPGAPIKGYVFAMFDEDKKDASIGQFELYWGVKSMGGVPKYPFSFTAGTTPPSTPRPRWCMANAASPSWAIQGAIDWACSGGRINCAFVSSGGPCFLSNSLPARATAVFNAYFQAQGQVAGSCIFSGTATTTSTDPSSGTCRLPGRPGLGNVLAS